MRAILGWTLATTFLLASCTLPEVGSDTIARATRKAKKPDAPKPRAEEPEAEESEEPAATPAATPTPVPTVTPAVPMKVLTGLVEIDANYVIAAGGGQVISFGGGNVIAAGAGNVISFGGGNVISFGGGNVISFGGGNVISFGGGNLLGGARYRALEAISVPLGTILPIKGMAVVPLSLTTGRPVGPAVLTDDKGVYAIQVPEAHKENILIYAALPAKDESDPILDDPRLRYGVVTDPAKHDGKAIDEDVSLVTKFVLTVFTAQLDEILAVKDGEFDAYMAQAFSTSGVLRDLQDFKAIVMDSMRDLHARSVAAGVPQKTAEARRRIAQRLADALLAPVDFGSLRINPQYYDLGGYDYPDWQATKDKLDGTKLVTEYYRESLAFLRGKTEAKMKANGDAFPPADYLAYFGWGPDKPKSIKRTSDFGWFMVQEYLSTSKKLPEDAPKLRTALEDIGGAYMPPGLITQGVIRAASLTILVQVQLQLIQMEAAARDRLFGSILKDE